MRPETVIARTELIVDELVARPWQAADAAALCAAVRESIGSLSRWLHWSHAGYGLVDAEQWIAHCAAGWDSGDHYAFAVFQADGGRFVGAVGLSQRNRVDNVAGLGYWTRESARGQAIIARVAPLVAAFGFRQVGLDRIEILAATGNLPSRRAAERVGARFEGILRNRLRVRGASVDAAAYSLIPGDL